MNFEKSVILVREVSERVPIDAELSPPGLRLHCERLSGSSYSHVGCGPYLPRLARLPTYPQRQLYTLEPVRGSDA